MCNTDPTVTRRIAKSFLWALKAAGVQDVPSYDAVVKLRDLVPTPTVKSANCIGGRTGLFYFTPSSETIKLWAAHPNVYPHLQVLPRKAGGPVRDFMDTPRARELFQSHQITNVKHGDTFYFIDDFVFWKHPMLEQPQLGRIVRLERDHCPLVESRMKEMVFVTIARCEQIDSTVFWLCLS